MLRGHGSIGGWMKHRGKQSLKFHIELTVASLKADSGSQALAEECKHGKLLSVVWDRGTKVAMTKAVGPSSDGYYEFNHAMSMVSTMYKEGDKFQPKTFKITVREGDVKASSKKNSKSLGTATLNFANYVGGLGERHEVELPIRMASGGTTLSVAIKTNWLKNYDPGEDAFSQLTDMTSLGFDDNSDADVSLPEINEAIPPMQLPPSTDSSTATKSASNPSQVLNTPPVSPHRDVEYQSLVSRLEEQNTSLHASLKSLQAEMDAKNEEHRSLERAFDEMRNELERQKWGSLDIEVMEKKLQATDMHVKQLSETNEKLAKERDDVKSQVASLETIREGLISENEALRTNVEERMQAELAAMKELEEVQLAYESDRQRLERTIQQSLEEVEEFRKLAETKSQELLESQEALSSVRSNLERVKMESRDKCTILEEKSTLALKEAATLSAKLDALKSELSTARDENENLISSLRREEAKTKLLSQQTAVSCDRMEDLANQLDELKAEASVLRTKEAEATRLTNDLEDQQQTTYAHCECLEKSLSDKESEILLLHERVQTGEAAIQRLQTSLSESSTQHEDERALLTEEIRTLKLSVATLQGNLSLETERTKKAGAHEAEERERTRALQEEYALLKVAKLESDEKHSALLAKYDELLNSTEQLRSARVADESTRAERESVLQHTSDYLRNELSQYQEKLCAEREVSEKLKAELATLSLKHNATCDELQGTTQKIHAITSEANIERKDAKITQSALTEEIGTLQSAVSSLKHDLEVSVGKCAVSEAKTRSLEASLSSIHKELESSNGENVVLQEQVNMLKKDLSRAQSDGEAMLQQSESLQKDLEVHLQILEEHKKEATIREGANQDLQSKLRNLLETRDQLGASQEEVDKLKVALTLSKAETDLRQATLQEKEDFIRILECKITSMQSLCDEKDFKLQTLQEDLTKALTAQTEADVNTASFKAQCQSLEEKVTNFVHTDRKLTNELQRAENRIVALEEEVSSLERLSSVAREESCVWKDTTEKLEMELKSVRDSTTILKESLKEREKQVEELQKQIAEKDMMESAVESKYLTEEVRRQNPTLSVKEDDGNEILQELISTKLSLAEWQEALTTCKHDLYCSRQRNIKLAEKLTSLQTKFALFKETH
eukprot:Rmarinus@m.5886